MSVATDVVMPRLSDSMEEGTVLKWLVEEGGEVKRGEPLYGTTEMTEYMQGVAHRNSRYAATFAHVLPWPNLVNHPYHGVDTAKYYRQAELELEQEKDVPARR